MPNSDDHSIEEQILKRVEHSLRNLRLADLDLLLSAAKLRNLGKAAAVHHLSQSAASAAIQRVEAAFGLELSTHERRQFALTREGEVLVPKIEEIVSQVRALVFSAEEPPLRLVTTHAIAQVVVPSLLPLNALEFQYMRPDEAYGAVLQGRADLALVLDNASWEGVVSTELGKGFFQLFCRLENIPPKPVLLPEDQMEVLLLQQRWRQEHGYPLPVKSRIPSWSLIGQICETDDEVGYMPDFLAKKHGLYPVPWQPEPTPYRILGLYREETLSSRLEGVLERIRAAKLG